VNPDPPLQGNALFGWTETSSFGELKRERGGGATTSIAVITPNSIQYNTRQRYPQDQRRRGNERWIKRGKTRTMALHDAEEFHHDFRGRANENLALSTTLSVDNAFLQNIAFRKRDVVDEAPLARQSFYVCEEV